MAVPPPELRDCAFPTPPVMDCSRTRIYGAPRGRPGRSPTGNPSDNVPVLAIAIHCIGETYDGFLAKACSSDGRLAPDGHASFHYVLDSESAQLTQLVPETDLAWAFQSYRSNFPVVAPVEPPACPATTCDPVPCPPPPPVVIDACDAYPGWTTLCALYPDLSADWYTINIGLTVPLRSEEQILDGSDDCCLGPFGLSLDAYNKLVRLTNWIAYRYGIPLDQQHVAFHDEISPHVLGCEECHCGADDHCFVCDVSRYCERCINEGDPSFASSDNIKYIYGENSAGCKVKVTVHNIAELIAAIKPITGEHVA